MSERDEIGAVEIAETYLKRCAKDAQRGNLTRLQEQSPEALDRARDTAASEAPEFADEPWSAQQADALLSAGR